MYSKQRKGAALYEVITYTLPKLHTKKSWYIDFRCYDPADREMKRIKMLVAYNNNRAFPIIYMYQFDRSYIRFIRQIG